MSDDLIHEYEKGAEKLLIRLEACLKLLNELVDIREKILVDFCEKNTPKIRNVLLNLQIKGKYIFSEEGKIEYTIYEVWNNIFDKNLASIYSDPLKFQEDGIYDALDKCKAAVETYGRRVQKSENLLIGLSNKSLDATKQFVLEDYYGTRE